MIELRRVLVNLRDACMSLQRESGSILTPELYPFFRDVYDHSLRLLDMVETLRDLLNNTFDVYLSSVANRTNQVMKVLTVLSTIALPALVISGIYGMNLKGLPFLESDHGTEIVVGAMVAPREWCCGCSRGSTGCRILDQMPFTPSTIAALVIAASFAAGLNVYATVLTLGLLAHSIGSPCRLAWKPWRTGGSLA